MNCFNISFLNFICVRVLTPLVLLWFAAMGAHAREYPQVYSGVWVAPGATGTYTSPLLRGQGSRGFPSAQAACAAACTQTYCQPKQTKMAFDWQGAVLDTPHAGRCVASGNTYGHWEIGVTEVELGCPWGGYLSTHGVCTAAPECGPGTSVDPLTSQCVAPCPPNQKRETLAGALTEGACIPIASAANEGHACPNVADPINPATGNKYHIETDFSVDRFQPLQFIRTYNSDNGVAGALGTGWRHDFERKLHMLPNGTLNVLRGDGKAYIFSKQAGLYRAADSNDYVVPLATNWLYVSADGSTENYDLYEKLVSITSNDGQTLAFAYDTTTGNLISIKNNNGRTLTFTHDALNRIVTMTDAGGGTYQYGYDANNLLATVQYPDESVRTYVYNERIHTGGADLPSALTGILDENGARFATFAYDALGRAVAGSNGNLTAFTLAYDTQGTTVTDPQGAQRRYGFETINGLVKSTGTSQPGGSGCGAAASALRYDARANPIRRDDFSGTRTCYGYDANNRETMRIEGLDHTADCAQLTSAQALPPTGARKYSTSYHPDWRVATHASSPGRRESTVYLGQPDSFNGHAVAQCSSVPPLPNGALLPLVCTSVVQALNAQGDIEGSTPALLTQFTYDATGRMLTRRDALHRTTQYTYYATTVRTGTAPQLRGHAIGDLQSVTDPAGQISTFDAYDGAGRLLQMTDPKGVVMQLRYTSRGWISSLSITPPGLPERVTRYAYDKAGQLLQVLSDDGRETRFEYDSAHRLTRVTDGKGNRVAYTLDALGNRILEQIFDPTGIVQRSTTRSFDALNRLQQVTEPL